MKTLLTAATVLIVAAGSWMSQPETPNAAPNRSTASVGTEAKSLAQKIPAPVGFPDTFRIQFKTSAGENVSTVAEYCGAQSSPETIYLWRSQPVQRTVDHPNLDVVVGPDPFVIPPVPRFVSVGPKIVSWPIDVIYGQKMGSFILRLGTGTAYIDSPPCFPRAGFVLTIGDFGCRTINYTGIYVGP